MAAQLVPVTQADIQSALRQLGLAGQAVCVHASLRSFGRVSGGAQAVVQAFLAEGCTLMAPSFSYDFAIAPPPDLRVPRNGLHYDRPYPGNTAGAHRRYTPASQEIDAGMGAIAAAVVQHPERLRGRHPLNSFSAVGPLAARLIAGQAPLAVYAPLRALVEVEGFVLLMGVRLDSMTLLHLAEQEAGRVPFRRWANDSAGRPQMVEAGGCSDGFERLAPVLRPWQRQIAVGASRWQVYPAGPALEAAAAAIRADPQITHCGNPDCERCNDALLGGPQLLVRAPLV
ncbi:MAG TPA: AAC(3) family N-acetyltransferase [Caldilineaceae bacterium]|nr:AAC(3) family N-acetyltransferase [Caldilineaceae bacterium]